jgi:hypothetical protein
VAWSNDPPRSDVLEGSKADGHRPSLPDFLFSETLAGRWPPWAVGRHGRKVAEIQAARRRPGREELFMTS